MWKKRKGYEGYPVIHIRIIIVKRPYLSRQYIPIQQIPLFRYKIIPIPYFRYFLPKVYHHIRDTIIPVFLLFQQRNVNGNELVRSVYGKVVRVRSLFL